MSDKMREEFEAEFRKHPKFEGNALYIDAMLERGSDGKYRFTIAEGAWWGWQASRSAVVIELPSADEFDVPSFAHDAIVGCWNAIEAAGLKVKS